MLILDPGVELDTKNYRTDRMSALALKNKLQMCRNNSTQVDLLTEYISEGLLKNEAVIIIARSALRKAVWTQLQALGLDMGFYKAQGQIKLYDAELLLSTILIDDVIDEHYFQTYIGSQIQAAQIAYGKVRAFGEMVEILWQGGLHDTALQLEKIRTDLGSKHELTVLCTYLVDSLAPPSHDFALEHMHMCKCHSDSLYVNSEESGGTLLELFGTAWTHMMSTLAQSQPVSTHLSSPSFKLN